MKVKASRRNSIAQGIIDEMSAGASSPNPIMEIYSGQMPAEVGGSFSGALLSSHDLEPTVGTVEQGAIVFGPISDEPAAKASGTAGWARVLDRDGQEAVYFSVSDGLGDGDIKFNTTEFSAGASVSISFLTVNIGGY